MPSCARFRYSELGLVETLLPLVESRVAHAQNSRFREPFFKLLNICSLAPLCDRANEAFTEHGLSAAISIFRVLGKLLWSSDGDIQSMTANALRNIAAGNDPMGSNTSVDHGDPNAVDCSQLHDLRPKPRNINQALLLGCGVLTTVLTCLETVLFSMLEARECMDQVSLQSSEFSDSDTIENVEPDEVTNNGDAVALETGGCASGEEGRPMTIKDVTAKHKVLVSLLELVRELSTDATSSAAMVELGLMSLLVQVMRAARGVYDPTLSITVEAMWNSLEHSQNAMIRGPPAESRSCLIHKARKSNAAFALSTWDGVMALRNVLETVLITGFRKQDKELRNDALVVASMLTRNGRSHPLFRKTGFLLLLLRYATAVETGLANGYPEAKDSEKRTIALATDGDDCGEMPELGALADPRNFATMADVDTQLKLLLWSMLAEFCKRDPRNFEVVEASPLIETLLMYVDLVVEEGPSIDAPAAGINRSVSLASMPSVGSCQTFSAPLEARVTATSRSKDDTGKRGSGEEAEIEPHDFTSTATLTTRIPRSHPEQRHRDSSSAENLTSSARISGTGSGCSVKEGSSAGGKRGRAGPFLGSTQLFVPAAVMRLSVTSIKLLQGQAIASLTLLAPRCPTKFQALGGHIMILRLLDRLGSRPENQSLVEKATKMLATMVGFPGLKDELGRVDGVKIMLDRFADTLRREPRGSGVNSSVGELDGHNNKIGEYGTRAYTVVILCRLCEHCLENQEAFRKANGVSIMVDAIKAYCWSRRSNMQLGEAISGGASGGVGNRGASGETLLSTCATGVGSENSVDESIDPALVHIVDCVWCAIVGNRRSEARLLQCEGLDALLDLLEICPSSMRHQVRVILPTPLICKPLALRFRGLSCRFFIYASALSDTLHPTRACPSPNERLRKVTGIVGDILRNKRAFQYAKAWRSDVNVLTITQLMMRLWVAEEARLGVSRPNGVLQNLWQPLRSHGLDTAYKSKRIDPPTQARRSRSATVRDPTNLTSGVDSASGDRILQTSPGVVKEVASLAPKYGMEIPEYCTLAGEISGGKEEFSGGKEEIFRGKEEFSGGKEEISGRAEMSKNQEVISGEHLAISLALHASKPVVSADQRCPSPSIDATVSKATRHLDLRGKISAVLERVGSFDDSVKDMLGPEDLKAFYMATGYLGFRKGEAWQEVKLSSSVKSVEVFS